MRAILFDLDGTLVPMDMDEFLEAYLEDFALYIASLGYPKEPLRKAIWMAYVAAMESDGEINNRDAFFFKLEEIYGVAADQLDAEFTEYYINQFDKVKSSVGYNPRAKEAVDIAHLATDTVILATNPLFPIEAVERRLSWAGLSLCDFTEVTHYYNSHYCKPSKEYYLELLTRHNLSPVDCLMIGNDTRDDMREPCILGMDTYLITDCLINKENIDLSLYKHGTFDDMINYLNSIRIEA